MSETSSTIVIIYKEGHAVKFGLKTLYCLELLIDESRLFIPRAVHPEDHDRQD